jgi:superfamily II DNA or RNA helicase
VSEDLVKLPPRFSQRHLVDDNGARQMMAMACEARLEAADGEWYAVASDGSRHQIRERGATPFGSVGLELPRASVEALPSPFAPEELRWVTNERPSDPVVVREQLTGRFVLRTEDPDAGTPGLRLPQTGALHAVLAHWSTGSSEPVTVVLPTGTGKTETMVSLFVSERPERLLVVVPSDRLRTQIAEKFETYGVLPGVGVLDAPLPGLVVGRIEHHFSDIAAMRSFVERCNVLVTTPNALDASNEGVRAALIARCSHLFVDEAHHVPARRWARIRDAFAGKPVLQFTATPYREDGQRLGGRVIYSFPLGRARTLGYFQPISYVSVIALANPDRAVAQAAIEQLRADRAAGFDHLIMARVGRIGRARDDVLPIYEELAPEFAPRVLHSALPKSEQAQALEAIRRRESRIVICVDMLGEGFDFPELKVAALHDPHRSLGVALQFIGRFARSRDDLGIATAVVARPDPGYDERLRALYAEGSEWDAVIERLAGDAIDDVRELDEFETGFGESEDEGLSIHILRPKMSTVVYETSCGEWEPGRLAECFASERVISRPAINPSERVVWMVVEARTGVKWAHLQSLQDVAYHLHVLYWDRDRSLLYINTSQLESLHENLAQAVCGEDVRRVEGEPVYRVLGELQRPTPTNVGVIDLRNRSRRFSMHVGADVYEGFPDAERQSKSNTNIFVVAYDKGERVTLGAARKGRIWSQQAADTVLEWVQWCQRLGPRLQDESISLDGLFRSFVRPSPLEERPPLVPLAIDWPWIAYAEVSEVVKVAIDGTDGLLIDSELVVTEHSDEGSIPFEIRVGNLALAYEATVEDGALVHRAVGRDALVVRERSEPQALSDFLNREGSTVWFEQDVVVEGSVLHELQREQVPIDMGKLIALDWEGVDIQRESQGQQRDRGTVQARAAERLISLAEWDVVIDDDGTGEVADLVALKDDGERVIVHLVHCKYSSSATAGARVGDLYVVCGQAHRSAHHRQHIDAMVANLIRRERQRQQNGHSGLLVGDDAALLAFQDVVRRRRPTLRVTVVQPGLSKAKAEARHLQLLGAADVYVAEVAYGVFDVWCSA